MSRGYNEATKELWKELQRRKEAFLVSGGILDKGLENVQNVLRFKEDCTVEVHRWIADIPYDASKGLAKACKEDKLEEEHLPQ